VLPCSVQEQLPAGVPDKGDNRAGVNV
jgi:hypothetical protein